MHEYVGCADVVFLVYIISQSVLRQPFMCNSSGVVVFIGFFVDQESSSLCVLRYLMAIFTG